MSTRGWDRLAELAIWIALPFMVASSQSAIIGEKFNIEHLGGLGTEINSLTGSGENYLIVGDAEGVEILELSDPVHPTLVNRPISRTSFNQCDAKSSIRVTTTSGADASLR